METIARRTGITERDVWAAADAVLAHGKRPTIEAVRHHLGRGSPNTVQTYLDTWFGALAQRVREPTGSASSIQAGVPAPVARATASLWESALALAREAVESELAAKRTDLEAAQRQFAHEQQVLATREASIDAKVAAAQGQVATVSREREASDAREQAAIAALARAETRIETLTQELTRRGDAQHALEAARERDRGEAQAQLTAAHERLEGQERHWRAEVERARAELREARSRIQALERDLAERDKADRAQTKTHENRLDGLRGELSQAQTRLASVSAERDTLRRELAPRRISKTPAVTGHGRVKTLRKRTVRGT